ncbi:MAG: chemotaxis protein CheD [Spirochaetales bacterium]|nr:chemotaxis protein CheD [Spirochaetales bacterium]
MIKTYNSKFGKDVITVHPGEYWIDDHNIIYTLLGTCVAVVLYSESHRVGGMNHYLLPGPMSSVNAMKQESARYGINAMELLINGFLKRGIEKKELKAKIFGGGKILKVIPGKEKLQHVGEKNIEFVRFFLAEEKIPIVASDVGGTGGRKIFLFPETGKVLLSRIKVRASLINMETKFKEEISVEKQGGDIILFNNDE